MRIALTGAAGFVGTSLRHLLVERGHDVFGIDNLSLGQAAPAAGPCFAFRQLDICDQAGIRAAFGEFAPQQVVHLAAIHHIPTCEDDAPEAMRVNVVGTQIILDEAAAAACRRVVLASSGAVYRWQEGPLDPIRTPVEPCDVYSTAKAANEQQLAVWARKHGGVGVVARLFNTIGPNDLNGHLIPEIVAQLRAQAQANGGERVVRLGNTASKRDYVYVDDAAAAFAAMVDGELAAGIHTFNVGTGVEHSVLDVLDGIAAVLGVRYRVETDPARLRRVDRLHQIADTRATREALGWTPRLALRDALARTLVSVA
jgi:UDP-glucose 4-epimerase